MTFETEFEKIKYYYDQDFWSKKWVRNAVVQGAITEAEYELIVGEKY